MKNNRKDMKTIKQGRAVALVFLSIVLSASCSDSMRIEEANHYIFNPENGLCKTATTANIEYKLVYKPVELVFAGAKQEVIEKELSAMHYFLLMMSTHDQKEISRLARNQEQYTQLIQTLNSGINEHVHLYTNRGDTISPVASQYVSYFNLGNSSNVLFALKSEKILQAGKIKIVFDKIVPVDPGPVEFNYKVKDIKNIPEIITKTQKNEN